MKRRTTYPSPAATNSLTNVHSALLIIFLLTLALMGAWRPTQPLLPPIAVRLLPVATGLVAPVAMAYPSDGSGRLFIVEQTGQIRIVQQGKLLSQAFLDLNSKLDRLNRDYSEKGLLGLAFHPQYRSNGLFYVYYSAPSHQGVNHESHISEFKVSADANLADATSERLLLTIGEPEANHNGGTIAFGPDGFLYVGSGDGGGAGDKHGTLGNGQNLTTLLGKILRIDVNHSIPYSIPADNPFANKAGCRVEIYAYGLRNPWKFSFDRTTGQLFCGDVGQDTYEEVDIIQKGGNYGWRIMEAAHCFNPLRDCPTTGLQLPIAEYTHREGNSVTGGYVYRGKAFPGLAGRYVFGDWSGKLMFLAPSGNNWLRGELHQQGHTDNLAGANVNSLGEDAAGELYFLLQGHTGPDPAYATGTLVKLVP